MSVINQVLVELERRRAAPGERGPISDHVRALPDGRGESRGWWIVAGSVGGIALLGTIWAASAGYGFSRPAPAAAAAEAGTAIEKAVAASAGAEARTPHGDGAPEAASRLSFELSFVPEPQSAARASPEPARPPAPIPAERVLSRAGAERSAGKAVEAAAVAAAPPPAVPVKDAARQPAAAGPGAGDRGAAATDPKAEIKKEVRQPTARDLAENEYRKAATLLQQGRLAEAQEGFRATLALHAAHHGARQALVALLLDAKMGAEAERVLQEGLRLAPEQIGFAMTLARVQVDRGDNAGAIATLQGGAAHAQGNPDYLAFLAALLQRQGRHEEAIERFGAALRARPGAGVWWLGLGVSLQAVNRAAEAQEAYRRAKSSNLNAELAAFADQRLRQLQ